ncbi:hypothetical protein [Roseomonas chloroacetimidivorans]|uniref:hypothetical protein n=1 Tax=Roseomonas chloroacetimidivorans TaxID=1766656 RepID=UPI003C73E75D
MVAVKIEGLAEAESAAEETLQKYLSAREQKAQAEKTMQDGMARRAKLLAAAKAGEVVAASEVAEVEVAIRTAEATAALIGEALPALLKAAEEAEREVQRLACLPKRAEIAAAAKRLQDAEEAYTAALREKREAWQTHETLKGWDASFGGHVQLEQYAPAALARRARLDEVKAADQKAAAEKQRRERVQATWEADQRAIREKERAFYRDTGMPLPAHLAG